MNMWEGKIVIGQQTDVNNSQRLFLEICNQKKKEG